MDLRLRFDTKNAIKMSTYMRGEVEPSRRITMREFFVSKFMNESKEFLFLCWDFLSVCFSLLFVSCLFKSPTERKAAKQSAVVLRRVQKCWNNFGGAHTKVISKGRGTEIGEEKLLTRSSVEYISSTIIEVRCIRFFFGRMSIKIRW